MGIPARLNQITPLICYQFKKFWPVIIVQTEVHPQSWNNIYSQDLIVPNIYQHLYQTLKFYFTRIWWKLCQLVYFKTLYYLDNKSTCWSLVEASSLVNIISWYKLALWNFKCSFIVLVSRYFTTIDVPYIDWYTKIECSLSFEIIMYIKKCAYTRKLICNTFQVYTKTTFLVPRMYTNIYSYQHTATQITWNHLVHTFNIHKFDIWTVWRLLHISANWWVHQQITFHN